MKNFLKSLKWVPITVVMIISFNLSLRYGLPEFFMKFLRRTGPLALIIPSFVYSWMLFAIYFFKKEGVKVITLYAFISAEYFY